MGSQFWQPLTLSPLPLYFLAPEISPTPSHVPFSPFPFIPSPTPHLRPTLPSNPNFSPPGSLSLLGLLSP